MNKAFVREPDPEPPSCPGPDGCGSAGIPVSPVTLAAHVAHQVFGAIGITLEGPVFRVSRRLRQLASQPPTDAAAREAVLTSFEKESA